MIVLSNSATQTLAPGQSMTFDLTVLHTGCAECHRQGSSGIKLRNQGIYELMFHGNIGATAVGTASLRLKAGGEDLPETTMIATVDTVGALYNVSTATLLKNCCGDNDRITVTNVGTTSVVIAPNSSFIAKRLA